MKSLYESLLDDDDVVLKRANNRTLIFQVDKMLESKTPNPELIKLLESKVAVYSVDDGRTLKSLISNYIRLAGNDCSLNWIDTSNVKSMSYMFYGSSKFTGDISKWDVGKVIDMSGMFYDSNFNGDISKWNVSNVRDMNDMFFGSKFNRDISKWNVSNVEDMSHMFENSKFNRDISKWNVGKVEDMKGMFDSSDFNGDISKWDVSNVEDMSYMFVNSKFNSDISKWNVSNVKSIADVFVFNNCPIKEEYKPKFD